MLAIGLEFLTGRYAATAYNDRSLAEWPPHPARLFSALVATWQDGEPASDQGERECMALRFLERLDAPQLLCSSNDEIGRRSICPVFVPVNDAATVSEPDSRKLEAAEQAVGEASDDKARKKAEKELDKARQKLLDDTAKAVAVPSKYTADFGLGARVLPEQRGKQPRTFPSVTPACPRLALIWPEASLPDDLEPALRGLLARLVRLGHSSSMVSARLLAPEDVEALSRDTTRFVPDDDSGEHMIRWVSDGQVERLGRAFALHGETEPRVLPARFVRYREGTRTTIEKPVAGLFSHDDVIIFARVGGPRLPITSTAGVAKQVRRALIAAVGSEVPSLLSGHAADGKALERVHAAIVPLPVVGHEHADGTIVGVGLFLPRECDPNERMKLFAGVGKLEALQPGDDDPPVVQLLLGNAGVLELQRIAWGEHPTRALRPWWWTRASRFWASATPVALDRNPGNLHDADPGRRNEAYSDAKESIRVAVERAGYPAPVEVDVVRSCVLPGSAKPRTFPRYPVEGQRPQRVLVHTRIVFATPIRGPLLLGAGRYCGLGLHLPVDRPTQPELP